MNLAYVTETVIGLALVSIGVGWFVAGLAYFATRPMLKTMWKKYTV